MSTPSQELPPKGTEVGKDEVDKKKNNKSKKRQGKASKAKSDDKFRERMNEIEARQHQAYLDRVLCVNKNEDTKPLKRVMEDMRVPQRPVAKQLSVTTRGIGFSTTIFYDRAMTTWSTSALWEICSVHQMYRVGLWLAHYKLSLAQSIQSEPTAVNFTNRIHISDEFVKILEPLHLVPSVWGLIFDCIGKVTADQVYHSGYSQRPDTPAEVLEWLILSCSPITIRELLTTASNLDEASLQIFRQYNPIPGVRYGPTGVTNGDDIYPEEYTPANLRDDVHCYLNLLTRVQNRLPRHTLIEYQMSGTGLKSGLWSCIPVAAANVAHFSTRIVSVPRVQEPRTARGRRTTNGEMLVRNTVYEHSTINSSVTDFWSVGATDDDDALIGSMSLVGEECFLGTRFKMNSKAITTVDPISVMFALLDAPK